MASTIYLFRLNSNKVNNIPQLEVKIDASVKSTLPTRFWSVGGATARADSWFLQRFSDFWRLHQDR